MIDYFSWRKVVLGILAIPSVCSYGEDLSSATRLKFSICQRLYATPIDDLRNELRASVEALLASKLAGGLTVDQFWQRLDFFVKSQRQAVTRMNRIPGEDWPVNPDPLAASNCRYRTNSRTPVEEIKFQNLSFIGVEHFYTIPRAQHPEARQALLDRLGEEDPNAFLLEGFPLGKIVPCQSVIGAVFTNDANIHEESDVLLKFAFLHDKVLIAADNQRVDDLSTRLMFRGDQSEALRLKNDLAFVDALHFYYTFLLSGTDRPVDRALSNVNAANDLHPPLGADAFRKKYFDLNRRELPTDPKAIYEDFTPSAFLSSPRGTNLICDQQDNLRNRSLLRAIQLAFKNYSKPMVVFGSGLLLAIGGTLEKEIGSATNIDFRGTCAR